MIYIAVILGCMILILMIRALRFKPLREENVEPFHTAVDKEKVIEHLTGMIRCKTVSYLDISMENPEAFEEFRQLMKDCYPLVHKYCKLQRIGRTGLLYHWNGKSSEKPTVFMAHYDVVPAREEDWEYPPFAGVIRDGVLWGRGTLDTKGTLCGIMEAAEKLISEEFIPENDVYFSFSGEEETNGADASLIVDYLKEKGIRPSMVLDEGGAIVEGIFPGVKRKCALVGTGEKGKMHIKLSVKSKGGHASSPPVHSPVGILAESICRVEKHPLHFHLSDPVKEMFNTVGRYAGFGLRFILSNLFFFSPVLNLVTRKTGGELNAMVRSTVAFTKTRAGDAVNVFPPYASVEGDVRMMVGDTSDSVIRDIHNRVKNEQVTIESTYVSEVVSVSKAGSEPWQRLNKAIREVWPAAVVSPYLMIACSDSRHFTRICDNVLRFSAMELSSTERKLIHGHNERIPLAKIIKTVEFFVCIIKKC